MGLQQISGVVFFVAACFGVAPAHAVESVNYAITHTTVVQIPAGYELVRVFHAVPLQLDVRGRKSAKVTPRDGLELIPAKDGVGYYWRWQWDHPKPASMTCTSRYALSSKDRVLDRKKAGRLSWRHVRASKKIKTETEQLPGVVFDVARSLRRDKPLETLDAICAWVRKEIRYDAKVKHGTRDVAEIFAKRCGWCGHQKTAFVALCHANGIETRQAFGFSLKNKDGLWNGRGDWNRHTWSEVNLGYLGWQEIDPAAKEPWHIPARLVRNPPSLQSHIIWGKKAGKWERITSYVNTVRAEQD